MPRAPPCDEPISSVMASSPTAVALINQRTFCARVRSRRKKPSTIKMARPIKIAISCLGSSSGTVEPVTASDSVHRKNAYRLHFKADAAEQAHDDEIRPADYRKDKKGERNGGGRLVALRDNELQTGEDLEQRQQYEDGYSSCTSQLGARPMMFSQWVMGRRTPLRSTR